MTSGVLVGLALALAASLLLNGGYLVQHRGSRSAPAVSVRRPLATLRGLGASRLWLAGTVAGLGGWGLHVVALSHAPLALVEAFSAGGLALLLPVTARLSRSPLAVLDVVALAGMGAALAALGAGTGGAGRLVAPAGPLSGYLGLMVLLGGALAAAPRRRAHALGLAAGVLYGAGDAATKAVTGAAHAGWAAGLTSPWVLAVVVLSCGAFFCFQRGLQLGSPFAVIALMTAGTNLVAVVGGLTAFGEPLGASSGWAALHAGALAAVCLSAWRLAPLQLRLVDAGQPGPEPLPGPSSVELNPGR